MESNANELFEKLFINSKNKSETDEKARWLSLELQKNKRLPGLPMDVLLHIMQFVPKEKRKDAVVVGDWVILKTPDCCKLLNYQKQTKAELLARCSALNITRCASKTKPQLRELNCGKTTTVETLETRVCYCDVPVLVADREGVERCIRKGCFSSGYRGGWARFHVITLELFIARSKKDAIDDIAIRTFGSKRLDYQMLMYVYTRIIPFESVLLDTPMHYL